MLNTKDQLFPPEIYFVIKTFVSIIVMPLSKHFLFNLFYQSAGFNK